MSNDASTPAKPASAGTAHKLGMWALAAIIVSSMVGGGVYSLPQNMAASASAGAVLLAWVITGFGIFFIANTFRTLSILKPELTSGIYMYSRDGFGPFAGFTIAWGYWLCQIFGNVGYAVMTMDALDYFFPGTFAGGNNLPSIIGGSLLIWGFNFIVLRGVHQATIINTIGTIAKLVPLLLFIIILFFTFHWDKFSFDFLGQMCGKGFNDLGGLGAQLKSTMLVTLWAFIGIEGAVVLSDRAKSPQAVAHATVVGFLGCLLIYVLLSILPFGFLTQAELAAVPNPSTAGVLEKVVGPWGSWLMNAGVVIAVLVSWLAWTMITAEMPYAAAKNGTFPKAFARSNKNGSPSVSLWVTSVLMQLAMVFVYFANNAWNTMLDITGVMVLPAYLMSTLYLFKIARDPSLYGKGVSVKVWSALVSSVIGSLFALWLMYAAGPKYLLMAVIFLAVGTPVFVWARRENRDGKPLFGKWECVGAGLLWTVALLAIVLFSTGTLKLD